MAPLLTVTPNAALDRTLWVDELRPGARHCVVREQIQAGGKGVNVARVLASLGHRVSAVVVVAGASGDAILRDLERSGLDPVAIAARGESRTCLEVLEQESARATQLHGAGVGAAAETADSLVAAVASRLARVSWLALCGSLPLGLPTDTYARLVALARERGVRVALDASGPALRAGWEAGPDLVRVNRSEAAEILGCAPDSLRLPPATMPGPAAWSVVTDGRRPSIAWSREGPSWRVVPPAVRLRNPIGCGDAMLAGLLTELAAGRTFPDALRFATALGAADAESYCAGRPDASRARALERDVQIENAVDGGL